jgi:hypothetical protein
VLLLVVDQDEKAAIVVVERIDAHSSPDRLVEMGEQTILGRQRGRSGFRQSA